MIGIAEHSLEKQASFLQAVGVGPSGPGKRLDQPERAEIEGAFLLGNVVRRLGGIIAVNQPVRTQATVLRVPEFLNEFDDVLNGDFLILCSELFEERKRFFRFPSGAGFTADLAGIAEISAEPLVDHHRDFDVRGVELRELVVFAVAGNAPSRRLTWIGAGDGGGEDV